MWHMYWKEKRKGENFYSHIPCEMWRSSVVSVTFSYLFLLTHPVWDVTSTPHFFAAFSFNFYSHIPCGMWPIIDIGTIFHFYFYSHIPCGMWLNRLRLRQMYQYFYSHIPCGMWLLVCDVYLSLLKFLLTHPVWDVTFCFFFILSCFIISTHTSRVGCDNLLR